MIWKILGIEQTKDKDKIKAAYRKALPLVNPEDDAEGFKELRKAYEEAMIFADTIEKEKTEDENLFVKKDEVDLWIDRIDKIYQDIQTRKDDKLWENLLEDEVCDDLDTELEAGE